jgi:elongation factor P
LLRFLNSRIRNKPFMASANDLRKGMALNYNGDISVVLDMQHRTPGNLRAFVQASLRSIRTGKTSDVRFSSTEKIDVVPMMTRKMDFSYKDGEDFVFSDPETFETTTLAPELVGEAKNYLVENGSVTVTFVEDKAVLVELPSSVVLKVADAPEGIRGDSSSNVQKAIVLETGITVQAPHGEVHGEGLIIKERRAQMGFLAAFSRIQAAYA